MSICKLYDSAQKVGKLQQLTKLKISFFFMQASDTHLCGYLLINKVVVFSVHFPDAHSNSMDKVIILQVENDKDFACIKALGGVRNVLF